MATEYEIATTNVGFTPLANWSTLEVLGSDRATFLHNMCTNDIRSLQTGQGCEAFFTDVKGRTIGHGFFLAADESILVLMTPEQSAKLIPHLDRYIIREDVTLADRSADLHWLLAFGRGTSQLASSIGAVHAAVLDAGWSHAELSFAGRTIRLVKCDSPWCGGFLMGGHEASLASIAEKTEAIGGIACDAEVWHTVRIESGWPLFGVDFGSDNLPQEIGRDQVAISFRKGCYLGQETVARIDALGHVNQLLSTVRFAGATTPEGREIIADGKSVGRVTSSCWSPQLGAAIGLAMLRRSAAEMGARLDCSGSAAEVIRTPAVGG